MPTPFYVKSPRPAGGTQDCPDSEEASEETTRNGIASNETRQMDAASGSASTSTTPGRIDTRNNATVGGNMASFAHVHRDEMVMPGAKFGSADQRQGVEPVSMQQGSLMRLPPPPRQHTIAELAQIAGIRPDEVAASFNADDSVAIGGRDGETEAAPAVASAYPATASLATASDGGSTLQVMDEGKSVTYKRTAVQQSASSILSLPPNSGGGNDSEDKDSFRENKKKKARGLGALPLSRDASKPPTPIETSRATSPRLGSHKVEPACLDQDLLWGHILGTADKTGGGLNWQQKGGSKGSEGSSSMNVNADSTTVRYSPDSLYCNQVYGHQQDAEGAPGAGSAAAAAAATLADEKAEEVKGDGVRPQASMTKQEWESYYHQQKHPALGGQIDEPAYALLTGRCYDPKTDAACVVSVPLTRIPATLGRAHDTHSASFFGLGTNKSLSRSHAVVYYRDSAGAGTIQLGFDSETPGTITKRCKKPKKSDGKHRNHSAEQIIRPKGIVSLPASGCFVVECLGKNGMVVGGEQIKQGQAAMLQHGTTIQMATYSLYFLLPQDAKLLDVKILNPAYADHQRSAKKMRRELEEIDVGTASSCSDDESTLANKPMQERGGFSNIQKAKIEQLEALPYRIALQRFNEAVNDPDEWEREYRLLNAAIIVHAVRAAARSKTLRRVQLESDGVQRSDVVKWVKKSSIFRPWVEKTMEGITPERFDIKIGKAIVKAGYTKTGGVGHWGWLLPDDLSSDSDSDGDSSDDSEEENAGNDSDNGSSGEEDSDKEDMGSKKRVLHGAVGRAAALNTEINSLSIEELLQQCAEACRGDKAWGTHHQLLNTAVAVRAVRTAAHSKELRKVALKAESEHGSVSVQRGDILRWIKNSHVYGEWANGLMENMVTKSYEAKITQAMVKSGCFMKVGNRGLTRWLLTNATAADEQEDCSASSDAGMEGVERREELDILKGSSVAELEANAKMSPSSSHSVAPSTPQNTVAEVAVKDPGNTVCVAANDEVKECAVEPSQGTDLGTHFM
mmetsp:Transcript_8329/g.16945  ORF Transcript_8329/g.16945 Transcript_8329/m.16945 type:complete len:1022 (-) Transcript_8329:990-4055(-)|eukprot:CAMPEP_0178569968 /NCGR_PEP_ID=MMETSP0697-20121206/16794_1 /TAXON_ID=265572 /ORGANISM="Extubocellulus spinifer, Strain CCMP396" /LENGTH=1021 /DNA_ID=CAMNT_0020204309 /DNA_START=224 /DNA_END=3289 /DNA_ORIENTATION=+